LNCSEGWINLQDGIPVREWVTTGKYEYFMYTLLAPPKV
jgi:hypothetical protein